MLRHQSGWVACPRLGVGMSCRDHATKKSLEHPRLMTTSSVQPGRVGRTTRLSWLRSSKRLSLTAGSSYSTGAFGRATSCRFATPTSKLSGPPGVTPLDVVCRHCGSQRKQTPHPQPLSRTGRGVKSEQAAQRLPTARLAKLMGPRLESLGSPERIAGSCETLL
jgi:hypothetical protein